MKRHGLSPEDILNNSGYELIEVVGYSDLKAFIMKEIEKKSALIIGYSIVQVLAFVVLGALLSFYSIGYFSDGRFKPELITIGIAVLFSMTLLIPMHELIHAAAFLILGKKDIGFGVQWKKFLFYAESNRQVLDRKEMIFVAFAPLVFIEVTSLILIIAWLSTLTTLFFIVVFTIHLLFCGGDMAIVSFFNRHKTNEIFTFDDRKEKRSYYYQKIG